MNSDWRKSTWGDEVTLNYGKALRGYQSDTSGFQVFGSNGPIGWTDKSLANGPGVILGRKGAYRGVHYSEDPFFVIDTAYYVEPNSQMDMRWLYYAIQHYKLGEIDDGSPIPSTTRAAVYPRELNVPPIETQREIAHTLGAIDDKIANNRALAADLEAMARAIFKSWFVDFGPVKAKMEGRAPSGMDADTAALFPDALVESELGLIPEGWEPATLASKADLNPESWTARNHPDSVLYADLAGTDRGQIVETKSFDWGDAPSRARRVLRPGDTIVGTVRPGNRAYSYVGAEDLTGSTGFAVLRPHEPSLRSFTYLAATADEAIERLTNLADGAAYPAVRPDVVAATPIVAAPGPVIEGFAKITQPLLDWVVASHAENTELAQLRDTLLPRLISGKLQLPAAGPEAEPLIEEDGLGV